MPEFEWDERKNSSNLLKHGLSFEEAQLIFEGPVLTRLDQRRDYGEQRKLGIGLIREVVAVTVVHTQRGAKVRIISARLANRQERNDYDAYLRGTAQGTRSTDR